LPREHDLRSSVVSCRDISGHLWVLNAGETEVANLQVAVFVDEDVGGLKIAVNDTGGVDVFQPALMVVLDAVHHPKIATQLTRI
jgi:hypothetical protein